MFFCWLDLPRINAQQTDGGAVGERWDDEEGERGLIEPLELLCVNVCQASLKA